MNIEHFEPMTGRMLKEDGTTLNLADMIGGKSTGRICDIGKYTPLCGRMVKENGEVVNVADELENFLGSGGGGGSASADIKEIHSSEPIITLEANTQYIFGEMATLEITCGEEKQGVVNIFAFTFTSGATPTRLTLEKSIFTGDFEVLANTKYICQICNDVLFYKAAEVA